MCFIEIRLKEGRHLEVVDLRFVQRSWRKAQWNLQGSGDVGSAMFGKTTGCEEVPADMDLVRIAIPRRAYTQSHIDYAIEVAEHVYKLRESLRGFRVIKQAPVLRHFTIEFAPVE